MTTPLTILFLLLGFFQASSKHEVGVVKDPDGYTNIRSEPNIKSDVIRRIDENELLWFIRTESPWLKVSNYFGGYTGKNEGYIHSSSVIPINDFGIQEIENFYGEEFEKEKKEIKLGDVEITMFNADRIVSDPYKVPEFISSYLEIRIPNQNPIRKYYPDINSLGGYAGVVHVPISSEPDYQFFIKEGDYDGRTIIVAKDGRVSDLEGGRFILYGHFLISEVMKDNDFGPIVWDLKLWKQVYDSSGNIPMYDFGYSYYLATRELYLKVEDKYDEDMVPKYFRLDEKGKFILQSNPPAMDKKVKMLPIGIR
jgi:hypothetical protein